MPYPRISIRALQALVAVYEEQSFSRAAVRENATQSGMSTQVKNLEQALGCMLLERGKGELVLTAAGRRVYEGGQIILRQMFALEAQVADLGGALTGALRFGMIPSLNRAVLPPVVQAFRADYPHVDVSVVEEYSYSLMRRVLEGELDFAVVPSGDVLSGLSASWLGRDREVLVCAPNAFPGRAHLSVAGPDVLDGIALIMPSSRNVRRPRLEAYLAARGVRPGPVLEMDGMLATLEFVATTDWCAILPSVLCSPDLDGRTRKLLSLRDPEMSTDYVAVQKAEKALGPAAEAMVARLRLETARVLAAWPG